MILAGRPMSLDSIFLGLLSLFISIGSSFRLSFHADFLSPLHSGTQIIFFSSASSSWRPEQGSSVTAAASLILDTQQHKVSAQPGAVTQI